MKELLIAFLAGGGTCALVQILMDRTKLQPGHVMVLLVVSGSILSFLGLGCLGLYIKKHSKKKIKYNK